MGRRSRKTSADQKDLTEQYLSGGLDEDRVDSEQRFTARSRNRQRDRMIKTSDMRQDRPGDADALPIGQVIQVFSRYCQVLSEGRKLLCTVRKTLTKVHGEIIVGDEVRFRLEPGRSEGAIEQILPRRTVLTRADSFKAITAHPIVANAEQVLIVASIRSPRVKWGLIDRMIVASQGGALKPIVCLNKLDIADADELVEARDVLKHYRSLDIHTIEASAELGTGLEELRQTLRDRVTVLAGHSGVGKSTLIRAIEPDLDIRIGEVSAATEKGRHTTTTARRYELKIGGAVIDTPGVKVFGLWNVTRENLVEYFPDVADETAPAWRRESFQRIADSLQK